MTFKDGLGVSIVFFLNGHATLGSGLRNIKFSEAKVKACIYNLKKV